MESSLIRPNPSGVGVSGLDHISAGAFQVRAVATPFVVVGRFVASFRGSSFIGIIGLVVVASVMSSSDDDRSGPAEHPSVAVTSRTKVGKGRPCTICPVWSKCPPRTRNPDCPVPLCVLFGR